MSMILNHQRQKRIGQYPDNKKVHANALLC
jgi:hypothetical protein